MPYDRHEASIRAGARGEPRVPRSLSDPTVMADHFLTRRRACLPPSADADA